MKNISDKETRLEAFERMLQAVREQYAEDDARMKELKAAGKEKTVTYRQFMSHKLQCQQILSLYKIYGLLDE